MIHALSKSWLQLQHLTKLAAAAAVLFLLPGCAEVFYAKSGKGTFSGKLIVEWIAPNQFIYKPDKEQPLAFVTSEGQRIQPQMMYTDGGSIPRLLWSSPNLGPWDFAPAYIIHDWLFHQHHCQLGDWRTVDFEKSAAILAEGIKTQLEKAGERQPALTYAIYQAVRSPVAARLWSNGFCSTPPASSTPLGGGTPPVILLQVNEQ